MRFNFFWPMIILLTIMSCKLDRNEKELEQTQKESDQKSTGTSYLINPQTSVATWIASSVIRKYDGTLAISKGQLQVSDKQELTGFFDLKMSELQLSPYNFKEEEKDTINQKILSEEYLAVDSFPSASFEILHIK